MKRLIALLIVLIMIMLPSIAYASHAPLKLTPRSEAYPSDNSDVSLISYLAYLKVRSGITYINVEMVLKNEGSSNTNVSMGIPSFFDPSTKVDSLKVSLHNQKVNFWGPKGIANPEDEDNREFPAKWYAWSIPLEAGEMNVVQYEFTISNPLYENGTKKVSYPLHFLKYWNGSIKQLQIVMDLDFYPPYVFEPNPSTPPLKYEESGHLTWRFIDVESPEDLILYFRPIDDIVGKYLASLNNEEINQIFSLYSNGSLNGTIQGINDFINNNPDSPHKSELKFLQALVYQRIFETDKVLSILNNIEDNWDEQPIYGEVSETILNKIIYDKAMIMKTSLGDESALEYLKLKKGTIKNNGIFSRWVDDEILRLTPEPEPEPQEKEEDPPEEEEQQAPIKPAVEVHTIDIFDYSIRVEFILLAVVLAIVVLYYWSKKNRRKRRKYLFR